MSEKPEAASFMECLSCASPNGWGVRHPEQHSFEYGCQDCDEAGVDFDEDVNGPMSVPWGFLL